MFQTKSQPGNIEFIISHIQLYTRVQSKYKELFPSEPEICWNNPTSNTNGCWGIGKNYVTWILSFEGTWRLLKDVSKAFYCILIFLPKISTLEVNKKLRVSLQLIIFRLTFQETRNTCSSWKGVSTTQRFTSSCPSASCCFLLKFLSLFSLFFLSFSFLYKALRLILFLMPDKATVLLFDAIFSFTRVLVTSPCKEGLDFANISGQG